MAKETKNKINIFFILVEFVLCCFVVAFISMNMFPLVVVTIMLVVFISPLPDIVLVRLGKEPLNRNIKCIVGLIGFVIICYMVPNEKMREVRQRQIENMESSQPVIEEPYSPE